MRNSDIWLHNEVTNDVPHDLESGLFLFSSTIASRFLCEYLWVVERCPDTAVWRPENLEISALSASIVVTTNVSVKFGGYGGLVIGKERYGRICAISFGGTNFLVIRFWAISVYEISQVNIMVLTFSKWIWSSGSGEGL